MALAEVRMVFWFVLFAWSGLACAFTPVVLCSLFWKGTTRAGAIAGMIGGFVTCVAWVVFFKEGFYDLVVFFKEGFYDLYEMLPGFAVGFLCTIGVSLFTEPPEGAGEEMDAVREAVGPVF